MDKIATRYPGTRPSDLYGRKDPNLPYDHPDNKGKLDEYQAFELDAAMAVRYSALEDDNWERRLHDIKESIRLTGRYHGQKQLRYKKYKSEIGDTHDDDHSEQSNQTIMVTKGTVIE